MTDSSFNQIFAKPSSSPVDLQDQIGLLQARLIVEQALDAIITFDANGLITNGNPQAERLFGWNARDVVFNPTDTVAR